VFRIERHRLGPRVYLFGVRLHEWHLGAAVLIALGTGIAVGLVHETLAASLAAGVGIWLIAKDWRDVGRLHRDTAAWRLGLHRRPFPLRALRRADPLPLLLAGIAAAIGLVNLLSAVTPNVHWRNHLLLKLAPIQELRVFHSLVIPASIALLVCAFYLYRRRLRALQLALALLIALAALNLLKGLDFEEGVGDLLAAAVLWLGRGSFYVEHEPLSPRAAVTRIPLLIFGALLSSFLVILVAAPAGASVTTVWQETLDLLTWQPGPLTFYDELGRLDLAIGLLGLLTVASCAYLLFRPLAAPRALPDREVRRAAGELVRTHGTDTLAYFKLGRDKHYLFSEDRRAFLGYRVESGVLLVSGDPVGPADALPALLAQLSGFAERRGLRIAAIGVSEQLRPLFAQLGLRALYLGDEAIVETGRFSLGGRPIRKVRQSVTRLEKAGYRCELFELGMLDAATLAELEHVSQRWRAGAAERGFSMSLDALRRDDQGDTLILAARDSSGRLRGFLHLVPVFGRSAMSLSVMRRERDTPNGLTEFLVVKTIEELRGLGVEELSLNFAMFARLLHSPHGILQRLLGRMISFADAFFQVERLYRFNAKFFPRWEPRYLMHEGILSLPRTGLAAMWIEGQLPKPSVGAQRRRKRRTAASDAGMPSR